MDFLVVIARLRARILFVVLALVVAVAVALSTKYSYTHGFRSKATLRGEASAQLLVDTTYSALRSIVASTTDAEINERAPLYAEYAASSQVTPIIAALAHVPRADLSVTADTSEVSEINGPTVSTSYNSAPSSGASRFEVMLTANNDLPIIDVSTEAPSAQEAVSLASATVAGLRDAVSSLAVAQHIPPAQRLDLRLLGSPQGGTVKTGPSASKAALYGVVAFIVLSLLVLVGDNLVTAGRRTELLARQPGAGMSDTSGRDWQQGESVPSPPTSRNPSPAGAEPDADELVPATDAANYSSEGPDSVTDEGNYSSDGADGVSDQADLASEEVEPTTDKPDS